MKLIIIFFTLFFLYVNSLYAKQAINLRVINGVSVPAQSQKWEWILSLRQDGQHVCGASLIAPTWAVTASHCISYQGLLTDATDISLMSDSYDVNSNEHIVNAKRIIRHPSYNEDTVDNDIALIELQEPINDVKTISLDSTSPLLKGSQSWVAGWGNMSTTGNYYPDDLMEVDLKIIDFYTCVYYYNLENTSLTSNMFCSGYMDGNQDSCQGDSGGPLIIPNGESYALAGIVSFGGSFDQMCGAPNYPGVYTKVQNYVGWIEGYTGKLTRSKTLKEVLIEHETYAIDGSFGQHDFEEASPAFDWAFTRISDNRSYQLQGKEATQNDVFGWEEVTIATPEPMWYMISLGSDIDGDGSQKFDWILIGIDTDSVYKLAGVNADGRFEYSKLDVKYHLLNGFISFY